MLLEALTGLGAALKFQGFDFPSTIGASFMVNHQLERSKATAYHLILCVKVKNQSRRLKVREGQPEIYFQLH